MSHQTNKIIHIYHEKNFFFSHKHFGKDFYHFAFTLIWLYVIHLIYSWQRLLSPNCAHRNSYEVRKAEATNYSPM